MTKRKKEDDTSNNNEALLAAKEARRKAWEAKQAEQNVEENSREEFRKFFIKIKGKIGLDKDMENVIWIHFTKAGFDKKEKFEEGIKHFGYKL